MLTVDVRTVLCFPRITRKGSRLVEQSTRAATLIYRYCSTFPEYLLVSSNSDLNRFVLPGGRVDPGELPQEVAVRKAREEAGARVQVRRRLGIYDHLKTSGVGVPTSVYLAECLDLNQSLESRRIRWVTCSHLQKHSLGLQSRVVQILELADTCLKYTRVS